MTLATVLHEGGPVIASLPSRRLSLRVVMTLGLTMLVLAGAYGVGLSRAIDDGLAGVWVRARALLELGSEDREAVVVVAIDAQTEAAWGPGPWSAEALLEQIEAGSPRLVAQVGHGQPFAQLPDAVYTHAAGAGWDTGGLRHGQLRDAGGGFAELAARFGYLAADDSVAVNWRPAAPIPVYSAAAVARGEIDPERFANRAVLIGFDLPTYALPVATPLGSMSPTRIEAHALHGLVQQPPAPPLPLAWRVGLALAFVLLSYARIGTLRSLRGGLLVVVGLALACVGLDLLALHRGWPQPDTGLYLLGLATLAGLHGALELLCMERELGGLEGVVLTDRLRGAGYSETYLSGTLTARAARQRLDGAPGPGVRAQLEQVSEGLELARDEQRASLELLEHFPLPVVLCSAWGELLFVSRQMRELLERRELDAPSDLFTLLHSLTDNDPAMVRRIMGRVAVTGLTLELGEDAHADQALERGQVWTLSRVSADRGDYLLLSARPMPELSNTPSTDLDLAGNSGVRARPRRVAGV